ncbi:MAG: PD-(D/E)XK nuclease family protein [Fibromonadaceae bacterium]|nr:PD-(D/E)XK nuclease family protein [Fibromonadaceae bacterium]
MDENLKSLLNIISGINEKYKEISRISGEKFNIFNILGLTNDELSHSKILAMLLNPDPKGSHGKGDLFLRLFFEKFLPEATINDFSKCRVYKEYSAGDLGRLDIYIDCQNLGVAIENKIYASDQNEQLIRYDKFLKIKFNENRYIIYLTLDGKEASKQSSEGVKYKTLSYKGDIQKWLELCKKESVDNPILRETLTQYILLIRQLTGQTRSRKMEEEVINAIVKDSKYVSAAFDIAGSIEAVKKHIVETIFLTPLRVIASDNKFKLTYNEDIFSKNGWFRLEEDSKKLRIFFRIYYNTRHFHYGLGCKNEADKKNLIEIISKESEYKDYTINSDDEGKYGKSLQLLYRDSDDLLCGNWGSNDFFIKITSSENGMKKLEEEFNKIIEGLIKIWDKLEEKLKEM